MSHNYMDESQKLAWQRRTCEDAWSRFHNPSFISPDPLEKVLQASQDDREAVALLSSCLAMGRVQSILSALDRILHPLGAYDGTFKKNLKSLTPDLLEKKLPLFIYRFFKTRDVHALLLRMGDAYRQYSGLECFFEASSGTAADHQGLDAYRRSPAMLGLRSMRTYFYSGYGSLHPLFMTDPDGTGASKRLHLFLRWMTRKDAVDPGGWTVLEPKDLWIPLDTHLMRHGENLGICTRNQPDARAVVELTEGFRRICPEDPCRYDFALSRMGIHPGASTEEADVYGKK